MKPNEKQTESPSPAQQLKKLEEQKAKAVSPEIKKAIEQKIDALKSGKVITKWYTVKN